MTLGIFAAIFLSGEVKDANTRKTMELYRGQGFTDLFVKFRFWDAPFEEIARLVPKRGKIVDLGCGDGILTNYLAVGSKNRKLIGIEIDKKRVGEADQNLSNTKFYQGDVLKKEIEMADCILMTHLLHHLPSRNDQEKLIKKVQSKLKKKGRLIISEVGRKPYYKFLISWVVDGFVVPILFEKRLMNLEFFYRKEMEWIELLENCGYRVKMMRAHKGKPFSHVIFVCVFEG